MNVSLTPELEELVQSKVATGLYNNASEVVREALRLLSEREELFEIKKEALRAHFAEGIAEAESGQLIDGDEALAQVRTHMKKRRKKRI